MQTKPLRNLLTVEHLTKANRDILNSVSKWPDDTPFIPPHLTVGEFKQLHGFYGSRDMMKYLVSIYVSRFARAYAIHNGLDLSAVALQLMDTEEAEYEAADILSKEYTEQLGPVSEERVKELDVIVQSWCLLDNQGLEDIASGKRTWDNVFDKGA